MCVTSQHTREVLLVSTWRSYAPIATSILCQWLYIIRNVQPSQVFHTDDSIVGHSTVQFKHMHYRNVPADQNIIHISAYVILTSSMKSMFKNFGKENPMEAALRKYSLLDDSTVLLNLGTLVGYYEKLRAQQKENDLIDFLITQMDKKKSSIVKLKILVLLFHISKVSDYDVVDLITRKKLKAFTEDPEKKTGVSVFEVTPSTKEVYIHKYILMPLYNYMIKLSTNDELYRICVSGEIPSDQVFRKGNKIRYVWVFKIYNLLNLLLPMTSPFLIVLQKFPQDNLFAEVLQLIKTDISYYGNFVGKCIEETSALNPFLMPYNDCLQYYESVKEYRMFRTKNEKLMQQVEQYAPEPSIRFHTVDETAFAQLDVLASRIQLISSSLRTSGNKEKERNHRMATEYHDKVDRFEKRLQTLTNEG